MADLTTLTDEELNALRVDALMEQERRQIVANAHDQIERAVRQATEAGVPLTVLEDALAEGLLPPNAPITSPPIGPESSAKP